MGERVQAAGASRGEPRPAVTVVIVAYRSEGTIDSALAPLRVDHLASRIGAIVVDNASGDGTVRRVRERHPWCTLVISPVNVGFGRGCNAGWVLARTPYVLFLNPDASISGEAIRRMATFLDAHPRAGLVGPAIRHDTGLQDAGGLPTPWTVMLQAAGWPRPYGRRPIIPGESPRRTDWLSGGILFARRKLLEELDGFDPRFFLYFEETDLCRRAAARGWEIWALGEAAGDHTAGTSARATGRELYSGCIALHYFQSRHHYITKHYGKLTAAVLELAEVALLSVRGAVRILRGRSARDLGIRFRMPLRHPGSPVASAHGMHGTA